ncbi:hypothetical protein BDV18DRAFT_160821 [Aspergillus unguis]
MAHNAMGRLVRCQTPNSLCQSISFTQKRSWSARTIPSFSPTSSPELNQLLNRFRDELFIPQSLNANQRKPIYRSSIADKLSGVPVVVPIGENEEPYQLRPLGVANLPSQKDMVKTLGLMAEEKNWSNLVIFLTGLSNGNRSPQQKHWEWLIRRCGANNGLWALYECAVQQKNTHFSLKDGNLADRLFFELHMVGQRNEFQGESFKKAEDLAQRFALLMEAPEHSSRNAARDPKKSPLVIGTLLELSAARALNKGGIDTGRKVETGCLRLLAALADQEFVINQTKWVHNDLLLQRLVPAYNGMQLALKMKDISKKDPLASELRESVSKVGSFIKELMAKAPRLGVSPQKPTIGLQQAKLLL